MIVINLWGGPSSGKSTNAAGLYYIMKINGFKVELIREFVKDLVWENHLSPLSDQNYIFAHQNRLIGRLENQVDFVITDSPVPLSCYYATKEYKEKNPLFEKSVWNIFSQYNNINFLMKKNHKFEEGGRIHNEQESEIINQGIKDMMIDNNILFYEIETKKTIINELLYFIYQINSHGYSQELIEKVFKENKTKNEQSGDNGMIFL